MMLHRSKGDYIVYLDRISHAGLRMKQQMGRLDRVASEMNAWLLAVAIGLGMLDLTVLVAKCLPPLPQMPVAAADAPADHAAAPAASPAPSAPRS